jgi:hypothetical protein
MMNKIDPRATIENYSAAEGLAPAAST